MQQVSLKRCGDTEQAAYVLYVHVLLSISFTSLKARGSVRLLYTYMHSFGITSVSVSDSKVIFCLICRRLACVSWENALLQKVMPGWLPESP